MLYHANYYHDKTCFVSIMSTEVFPFQCYHIPVHLYTQYNSEYTLTIVWLKI